MLRYFFIFLLSFNVLSSNENIVKTSELELFLFKIGFESLLKDVDITKDKSKLNEEEIQKINEKIELIMTELYKNSKVLFNDSKEKQVVTNIDNQELKNLKQEIAFLKQELVKLKKKNQEVKIKKEIKPNKYKVISNIANIYSNASQKAPIVRKIKRDEIIYISSCDKYNWCKLKTSNEYIKAFLIKKSK